MREAAFQLQAFDGASWRRAALMAGRLSPGLQNAAPFEVIWWFFAASLSFAVIPDYFGEVRGPAVLLFAIGGAAPCAWLWLLSRTLFRPRGALNRWSLLFLGAVIAIEATWRLTDVGSGELGRMAANAASLVCIAAFSLTVLEPIAGFGAGLALEERRFRQIFVGAFAGIVILTMVWASNATEASIAANWVDGVIGASALAALAGTRLAVMFRRRHPLADVLRAAPAKAVNRAPPDLKLARRIEDAVADKKWFATPDLKVADLAAALGEPEYKVSQCVTGALGFRNFNHLVNARRIDHAQRALTDSANARTPILSIAFECGFNSIGPFNRAFKQQVGMTPREFRAAHREGERAAAQ